MVITELRAYLTEWMSTENGVLFKYMVISPVILCFLYLVLFAPDRYLSHSKLSIQNVSDTQDTSSLINSIGFLAQPNQNDAMLLQAYLQSPQLLSLADAKLDMQSHFSSNFDFINGLSANASLEKFHDFYLQHVSIGVSPDSGLIEIRVEAYNPAFALKLTKFLIEEGERFINEINQNIARSEVIYSAEEMARSLESLQQSQNQLAAYQLEHNIASPETEGASIIEIVFQLESAVSEAKAELGQTLTFLSASSPQARSLVARINALEEQISEQKARVTGSQNESESMSRLGIEYSELQYRIEVDRAIHEAAVAAFEMAKQRATKQQKHLLVASKPVQAEEARYPRRAYWLITFILIFLASYGIVLSMLSSIREHRD